MVIPLGPGSAPSLLVGRDRELSVLRDHLAATLAGRGSLVLIGGEAGIGKTSLAEAICHEATEQGALVLTGRCFDLTETPAYGPLIYLFDRYQPGPDLPPPPAAFAEAGTVGAVASQATLFRQVLDFLKTLTAVRPVVLLLDDLHWSDPASLDLVRFLSQSIGTMPLLMVVTYRSDEITRRHPLYRLLPLLVREAGAERLDLRRLEAEDVRAYLTARYGLTDTDLTRMVAYLDARAEGNPFFVGELLRTLVAERVLSLTDGRWRFGDVTRVPVPQLLRQVIDGRVARLDEEAQHVLTVAAVIGHEVSFEVWMTVTGRDETALLTVVEAAMAAHLVDATADGTAFRFVHALIREALYEGIVPMRRRVLHRQIGEVLAEQSGADSDALAYHFQQAGDDRAVAWLIAAGERAQRAFAWLTAADRYEAAVALLPESGSKEIGRGWLLYRVSRMRRWENMERSVHYLTDALRIAETAGDRALAALVRFTRGIIRYTGTLEYAGGLADLLAGVEGVKNLTEAERERLQPYEPILALYPPVGLVMVYAGPGRYRELLAIMERQPTAFRAAAIAEEPATAVLINRRSAIAEGYVKLGHSTEAKAERAEDIAHFRATQNDQRLGQVLYGELQRVITYETDNIALRNRLAEESDEAYQRARAIGGGYTAPVPYAWMPLLVLEGKWAEARDLMNREVAEAIRRVLHPWPGMLARAQGETEEAWRVVHDALPDGVAEPGIIPFGYAQAGQQLAATLFLDTGDLVQARTWLDVHDRWLRWSGAVLGQSEGQALWAQYYRKAGDPDRAWHHVQRAIAHASEPRQPLALIAAHRLLGELATEAGRFEDAATHLHESLALADACVAIYERALSLLAYAELHAATKHVSDAQEALAEARTICESLGARPALARADAIAARLPVTDRTTPLYPDGLTEREAAVLRLVAGGKTNDEIADALYLSPRTIERHITNLYRKIEARGRADATAYALGHGLMTADRPS